MRKTVRIIDIANELGLSRNTVSKVLNGHKMPEKTRTIVLKKAMELGYKGMGDASRHIGVLRNQKILFVTSHSLTHLNYFVNIIMGIEEIASNYNFELIQYTFNELTTYKELSEYIKRLNIDGIICSDSFDQVLVRRLLQLRIPIVFIDFIVESSKLSGNYDVVMTENIKSVFSICSTLIENQYYKKFGFVGDIYHCRGFYERYIAMKEALAFHNLDYKTDYSILKPDSFPYGDKSEMMQVILNMEEVPEVFVCANDSIALSLTDALLALGYKTPKDICVIGFDNTVESQINKPSLTTIDIDKKALGRQAITTLIEKIKHPQSLNRTIYLNTNIIYRDTTPAIYKRT